MFRPRRSSSATKLKELQERLDLITATRGWVCLTGDDDLGEGASKNMPSTGTVPK